MIELKVNVKCNFNETNKNIRTLLLQMNINKFVVTKLMNSPQEDLLLFQYLIL